MLLVTSQIFMNSQSLPLMTPLATVGSSTGILSIMLLSSSFSRNTDLKKVELLEEDEVLADEDVLEDEVRLRLLRPDTT